MIAKSNVILVPIDFEDASRVALALARELGAALGAELVLAHVCAVPVYAYPGVAPVLMQGYSDELAAAAKKELERVAAENGGLRSILRVGDAATEILAVADELRPRLLVMGTHGRRGLRHLLLGSVAERVLRESPAPVVTARAPQTAS
jgi:nucleotide-binding universal stress UspA family protein